MDEDVLLCQSPEWAQLAAQWRLEPGVTYLNHGSFGPGPEPVLAVRRQWFARLERQPMDVLTRQLVPGLERARRALAGLVHCQPEDLVLVDNATVAMNVVANSVPLGPGDEVLLTDHVIVHGVLALVMHAGTARQRADNRHLEQGGFGSSSHPTICQNSCVCRAGDWS